MGSSKLVCDDYHYSIGITNLLPGEMLALMGPRYASNYAASTLLND